MPITPLSHTPLRRLIEINKVPYVMTLYYDLENVAKILLHPKKGTKNQLGAELPLSTLLGLKVPITTARGLLETAQFKDFINRKLLNHKPPVDVALWSLLDSLLEDFLKERSLREPDAPRPWEVDP